jgi:hypothetical protein
MIYKCRRTGTVISDNYNTMAILKEDQFRSLISEYPEYLKFLKKHLQKYKDFNFRFLAQMIQKIEFFQDISVDA